MWRKPILYISLHPTIFMFIIFNSFVGEPLSSLTYRTISSAITMLWLLPLLWHLLYLLLLSWCSSQISNTILNRNGKERHLCSLWYKAFMALTWVPLVPSFFGAFVGKGCYSFPKPFWHLLRCSCYFFCLSLSLLMWYTVFILLIALGQSKFAHWTEGGVTMMYSWPHLQVFYR